MIDHSAAKAMWEKRYGADNCAYGTEPNDTLKDPCPMESVGRQTARLNIANGIRPGPGKML